MMLKEVHLDEKAKNDIIHGKRIIGTGTDGTVYNMGDGTVFKFYHNNTDYIDVRNIGLDNEYVYDEDQDEQVNITDYKKLRNKNIKEDKRIIKYTDDDGVILTKEDALKKAIEKQKYVGHTNLPEGILYVNDRVAGCIYKYFPASLSIYAAAYLPLKLRLNICKALLVKVKELTNNYIYPVALSQKYREFFPVDKSDANVLIGASLEPKIIDLDGVSTLYSDKYLRDCYHKVETELSTLVLEILSKIKLGTEEIDESNIEIYYKELVEAGIPKYVAKEYLDYCKVDIYNLADTIKAMDRKRK